MRATWAAHLRLRKYIYSSYFDICSRHISYTSGVCNLISRYLFILFYSNRSIYLLMKEVTFTSME
jgi:hypothetical protein